MTEDTERKEADAVGGSPLQAVVMPFTLPEHCPRNLSDCEPLAQIGSDNGESFICCGRNDGKTRKVEGDEFRHCWKNSEADELGDWDRRDIIDTIYVLSRALSVDANTNDLAAENVRLRKRLNAAKAAMERSEGPFYEGMKALNGEEA